MSDRPPFLPFESFEIGQVATFGRYEVTAEEVVDFASKYDPQFFHLDPEAARDSLFGGLCASGWHTCAMTMAMMVEHQKQVGTSLGSPGVDEVRWLTPVYPGDVLSVRAEVLDLKPSGRRPDIGVVFQRITTLRGDDTPVLSFIARGMFRRGGAE